MNPDRWHQANHLYRAGKPAPIHAQGSIKCVGRCGVTIAANRRPPLCAACKLLFDAQVLVDTARAEAERAAQELQDQAGGAALGTGPEATPAPGGVG